MFVPEWAPGIHPMVVHFPIALLFFAVAADGVALLLAGNRYERVVALLYAAGAVACVAAYYSGHDAATAVPVPEGADRVLVEHEGWALRTTWFFLLFGAARVAAAWRLDSLRRGVRLALVIVAAAGLYLVYETGDHGAEMVYRYGVGVRPMVGNGNVHDHDAHGETSESGEDHH